MHRNAVAAKMGRDGCHRPSAFKVLPPSVVCSGGHCIRTCKDDDVRLTSSHSSHSSHSLPLPASTGLGMLGRSSLGCCQYVLGPVDVWNRIASAHVPVRHCVLVSLLRILSQISEITCLSSSQEHRPQSCERTMSCIPDAWSDLRDGGG